ncbi:hypothetical protein PFISCL1PPCAC_715, partial [Pristionchus fissidentatus]
IQGWRIQISVVIIFYCRWKIHNIPYDEDRLSTKYQVREVLRFSAAILPSVILSSVMHTFSLVPTILWQNQIIKYYICCVFYFSIHSLNCVFTKITLILCHPGMRVKLQLLFVTRLKYVSRMFYTNLNSICFQQSFIIQCIRLKCDNYSMQVSTDYLYVSIEMGFTVISLIIMIPCIVTLLRTTGIHENCKFLLVTSASVQLLLLIVQAMLFNYNIVIDNLAPPVELPFLCAQNGLFILSSHLSFVLVLER